ncbi:hypothetical protein G6O69_11430 [Pseudenhygromyxa sp. WMMC2535]|uniref:hypothetical protein n=1 Tax=Pseudenhygromyxa sp. WMMC2535 TaxID=2712867 RepID=UPI001553D5D4|nr:hypothetical protein [Pseudenhygromyxa sp. WMMC2535]NVB38444.1 hypothetical protein [Pseudenhygromyxa sp. WMMC2535]
MPTARELFMAHVFADVNDARTAEVGDARRSLTRAKLEALDQVEGLDEGGLRLVMPGLYQHIVATTIQIAARVGVAVGLALEAVDELQSQVAIGSFSRPVRDQMTETGIAMKRRHSSRIAKLVAEIAAQRLAWRHNHEFMSWLAFRRDDPRYPAADRRARLEAFKIVDRLLKGRESVSALLGHPLAVALEGHDRFMLVNRWRLDPRVPEHAVETYTWPLLSYQSAEVVELELARYHYDAIVAAGADAASRKPKHDELVELFARQLASALDHLPTEDVGTGVI